MTTREQALEAAAREARWTLEGVQKDTYYEVDGALAQIDAALALPRDKWRPAIAEVAAERRRQVEKEGWSERHDDQHTDRSMALAAALYASPIDLKEVEVRANGDIFVSDPWPWKFIAPVDSRGGSGNAWDKRQKHDQRRRLVIAAALIIAEIERIDRAQETSDADR